MKQFLKSWLGLRSAARPQPRELCSPEEKGLLRDVLDNPHEDVYLMIYADWLEDHGWPERADFVRLQVSQGIPRPEDRLRARKPRPDQGHQAVPASPWWVKLPRAPGVIWHSFERGLPRAQVQDLASFQYLVQVEMPCWLSLEIVTGCENERAVEQFLQSPDLARATELTLGGAGRWPALIEKLADSPFARNLMTLRLRHQGVNDQVAQALARSPYLDRLCKLEISHDALGPAGLEALAEARWFGQLVELTLDGNRVGPALRHLSAKAWPANLERLSLSHAELDADDLAVLAEGASAGSLQFLNVSSNWLGPAGVVALKEDDVFPRLTTLDLGGNRLGPAGARILAAAGLLGRLRVLHAGRNGFGDAGVEALAGCASLSRMEVLDLSSNEIGLAGLRALAARLGKTSSIRVNLTLNRNDREAAGWFGSNVYL